MPPRNKISRVRAPAGFSFYIHQGYNDRHVYVKLMNKHEIEVGRISLYKSYKNNNQYETHSQLDEDYRGKGFGTLLYSRAIQWCLENGYQVRSSGSSSELAQRVWRGKTLRQKFTIRKRNYTPYKDPSYDTWYAYPLKVEDGRSRKKTSGKPKSRAKKRR